MFGLDFYAIDGNKEVPQCISADGKKWLFV